ncbi:hypothetical protein [Parvularcula lutaonensis]|uniref:Uncharacterized protein n=1 Tax=Parvularcula lutaonensis TaxID=491923 RepID=A0ABV7MBU7_9PROT|nr:hypothetical protein [Parvularcula lutaonensis]GGY49129.1 hypothetical protein GCM10007148_17050 [Parvularcula lutaonensis]
MTTLIKAAAVAFLVATTAGAGAGERHYVSMSAAWASLTPDQRQMIDLVAADIWETERDNRAISYDALGERRKGALREQAMDRLGFEPRRRVRGVEA